MAHSEIKSFTSSRLQELAKDQNNVVYQYVHDRPVRVWPADEVQQTIRQIIPAAQQMRQAHPTWADAKIRLRLLRSCQQWREFEAQHKSIFGMIISPEFDDDRMHSIQTLLTVKRMREKGMPESTARDLLQQKFAQKYRTTKKVPTSGGTLMDAPKRSA